VRRSGKTMAMVKALPASGSVVVVHTRPMRTYLQQMLRDVRGPAVAGLTRVVVVNSCAAAEAELAGARMPIRIDHAVREGGVHWDVFVHAERLALASNLRFPDLPHDPFDCTPADGGDA